MLVLLLSPRPLHILLLDDEFCSMLRGLFKLHAGLLHSPWRTPRSLFSERWASSLARLGGALVPQRLDISLRGVLLDLVHEFINLALLVTSASHSSTC